MSFRFGLPLLFPAQATGGGEQPAWLVFAIVGGFLVVFPIFWCAIVWLLSRIGGWHRLAARYSSEESPTGQRFKTVTGRVGGTSYRNTLTIHLDDDGFFLEVNPLFRVGHPRLFIPWSDIGERTPRKVFWWQAERLAIGRPLVGTVTLPVEVLAQSPLGVTTSARRPR